MRFASTVTDGVVTYETVLMVDNTDLALRPGMTATAEIVVQKVEQALTVPNAALRFSPLSMKSGQKKKPSLLSAIMPQRPREKPATSAGEKKNGQQSVWVLLKDGQPRQVKVKAGFTDGSGTEILEGDLRSGELVITAALSGGKAR